MSQKLCYTKAVDQAGCHKVTGKLKLFVTANNGLDHGFVYIE